MTIIKKLSEMVGEEIAGAEKYIKCALKYKDENRSLADTFSNLSNEEMRHMQILHGEVAKLIDRYRQEHGAFIAL